MSAEGAPRQPPIGVCLIRTVPGTEAQQRAAFRDAYLALENRIKIFVALPIERLDRLAIKREVEAIGHLHLVGAAEPAL